MKYLLLFFIQAFAFSTEAQHPLQPKYKIGDTLSCGDIVFYAQDSAQIQHILVCSSKDASSSLVTWNNSNYSTTNATTDMLFDKPNADKIISALGNTGTYAALICKNYRSLTYCEGDSTSWYLPSILELNLMYTTLGNSGSFAKEGYWTSVEQPSPSDSLSEQQSTRSWIVDFYNGRAFPVDKMNNYHVRPVRELWVQFQ